MKKKIMVVLAILVLATCILSTSAFAAPNADANINTTDSVSETIYIFIGEMPYEVNKNVIVGYNNTVSGYYVKVLQMALVAVDHQNSDVSCHPGEVDSLFGANTYNATKAYKQYNNRLSLLYSGINRIDVDGYCGPATWTSLSLVCH